MRVGKWRFSWFWDWTSGGIGPRWDIMPADMLGPADYWFALDIGPLKLMASTY